MKENYRETEKAVLDSILGKGYDKRIRPSGQNITGNSYFVFLLYIVKHIVHEQAKGIPNWKMSKIMLNAKARKFQCQ